MHVNVFKNAKSLCKRAYNVAVRGPQPSKMPYLMADLSVSGRILCGVNSTLSLISVPSCLPFFAPRRHEAQHVGARLL